jgi:hypothetical protein
MGGSLPQPATRHPADQPPAAPRFNRALLPAELPAIGVSLRGGESGAGGDPRGPGLCRASPLQPCCRRARGGPWRQASAQRAFRSQFSIVWSECVTIGAFLSRGVGSRFEGEVTAVLLGALPDLALGARALPPPHARDARDADPLEVALVRRGIAGLPCGPYTACGSRRGCPRRREPPAATWSHRGAVRLGTAPRATGRSSRATPASPGHRGIRPVVRRRSARATSAGRDTAPPWRAGPGRAPAPPVRAAGSLVGTRVRRGGSAAAAAVGVAPQLTRDRRRRAAQAPGDAAHRLTTRASQGDLLALGGDR